MPAYRFSGRRYRRYRKYRRFYRRYRRGYGRRYVNASSRSSIRMKTQVNTSYNVTAGYGVDCTGAVPSYWSPFEGTISGASAANSQLYRTYCSLYEECKLVGMKLTLSITSAVGGTDVPSVQIYTSWDRKRGYGEPAMTLDEIKESANSTVATALNNNIAKITRSIYASDLMEKATWIDSTLDATNTNRNQAWATAGLNPNMFCPQFAFFLCCPSLGQTKSIGVSISIVYYFAFRNPRFGGSASSSKFVDTGIRAGYSIGDADDDEGNMDDGAAAAAALPDDDAGDLAAPAPMSRRARSNASADLQAAAAPSARRVRVVAPPKN